MRNTAGVSIAWKVRKHSIFPVPKVRCISGTSSKEDWSQNSGLEKSRFPNSDRTGPRALKPGKAPVVLGSSPKLRELPHDSRVLSEAWISPGGGRVLSEARRSPYVVWGEGAAENLGITPQGQVFPQVSSSSL